MLDSPPSSLVRLTHSPSTSMSPVPMAVMLLPAAAALGLGVGDVFFKRLIVAQRTVAVRPVRAELRVRRRAGIVFDDDAVTDAPPQLRYAVGSLCRGVQEREIKRIPARLAERHDIRYIGIDRHADIGIRHREEVPEMLDALIALHIQIMKAHTFSFRSRRRSSARPAGFSTKNVSAAASRNAAAKQSSV